MLPSHADAAALRRAALGVHEAHGALAGRPPAAEGLRRGARARVLLRRRSRSRRSSCSRRSACPAYKVASGEVTNPPLLEAIAATGRPVLLSTRDVGHGGRRARGARSLRDAGLAILLVMQCTSNYPCPPELVNLRAMTAMGERLGVPYGLSDHTPDIYTSIAAVALGAVAVEKHFTLSQAAVRPRPPRVARAARSWRGSSRASARSRRRWATA